MSSLGQQQQPQIRPELLQEIKLYSTNEEREKYDNLADLFAIVQTMEHLEKAYIRDTIPINEYAPACEKLIGQYRTAMNVSKSVVTSLEKFMQDYKLACPAAFQRLQIGVPATVEHGGTGASSDSKNSAIYIAETVQFFITLMDSLKLNMVAVDQVYPLLNDLMESMNKVSTLPPDWEGKVNIREWLVTVNKMQASEELDPDQVRQLSFDLEKYHNAFYRSLAGQ